MILTHRVKIGHYLKFWLATLALVVHWSAQAQVEPYAPFQISGTVIQNHDGDTFRIQTEERGVLVVRFSGSDTPETGQAYWRAARNTLRDILAGHEITIYC